MLPRKHIQRSPDTLEDDLRFLFEDKEFLAFQDELRSRMRSIQQREEADGTASDEDAADRCARRLLEAVRSLREEEAAGKRPLCRFLPLKLRPS